MHSSLKHAAAGNRPAIAPRRWIMLAAGLLALCLQLGAQIMPAEAMQGAMRAAALTNEEAAGFANTCLGFGGSRGDQPGQSGQHTSCPVCYTLAQVQGLAAPDLILAQAVAWTIQQPALPAQALPAASGRPAAFDSQAPPALAVL
ncbi:hypothetical protein [Dongia sp.]|uniref:hypothetical protein n=1 Tax=Dongia sp. TaxID=1977262 RepID=UPI0035B4B073